MGLKSKSKYMISNKSIEKYQLPSFNESIFILNLNYKSANLKLDPNLKEAIEKDVKKMPIRGQKLLKRASNDHLKNQIIDIFRPGADKGDGGTADGLLYELKTGNSINGKRHYIKAKERIRALNNIFRRYKLTKEDIEIINELSKELTKAVEEYDKWNQKK